MKRRILMWIALLCILMNMTASATSFSFVTNGPFVTDGPIQTIIPGTGSTSGGEIVPLPDLDAFNKHETTGKTELEEQSLLIHFITDRFLYVGDKKEYISVEGSFPEGCQILFVCYTGNQVSHILGDVYSSNYAAYWFPVPEVYDSIKVMIWDTLGNCIPITGAKIYKPR